MARFGDVKVRRRRRYRDRGEWLQTGEELRYIVRTILTHRAFPRVPALPRARYSNKMRAFSPLTLLRNAVVSTSMMSTLCYFLFIFVMPEADTVLVGL